ncbi:MAG TPA: 4Fe-4S dicluster domain-containing protein [bacterium]|nr:4Fe-4S dicluster domain-containing protein [bacterium]
MSRSRIFIDPGRCDYCGTCVAVCPADSITLEESTVFVDDKTCTRCLACVRICPLGVPREVSQ